MGVHGVDMAPCRNTANSLYGVHQRNVAGGAIEYVYEFAFAFHLHQRIPTFNDRGGFAILQP